MIARYTPMAPTLVREPFHRPGWIYEEKVDGYRMLAYKTAKWRSDAVASPPVLIAFDLLYLNGRDVSARQLRDRRARLEDVVAGSGLVFPVRRLAADGLEAWAQVVDRGYEGLVAKDEISAYEGGLTRRWLKVKQKGWTDTEDRWRRALLAP